MITSAHLVSPYWSRIEAALPPRLASVQKAVALESMAQGCSSKQMQVVLESTFSGLCRAHGLTTTKSQAKRTSTDELRETLDRLETDALAELRRLLTVARDTLMAFVLRHPDDLTSYLSDLRLKGASDLQNVVKEWLRGAYEAGTVSLRREAKQYRQAKPTFVPTDALRFLNAKAVEVANVLKQRVLDESKQALLQSLKQGESTQAAMVRLESVFEPYLGNETVLEDGEPLAPYRLENVVRTNTTDAFNQGRVVQAREYSDVLHGMRYSSVIDDSTTEVCRLLDGYIIPLDDPALDALVPPNHFNALASGTLVRTLFGDVPIEQVTPDTLVWTHRSRWRRVYAVMGKPVDAPTIRELQLSTGRSLRITNEHPVLTSDGWKLAGNLQIGDVVFDYGQQVPGIGRDVPLPDPNNYPSLFDEPSVSWTVMRLATSAPMILPIDFNSHAVCRKREIENVPPDTVLTGHSGIPETQQAKKHRFGVRRGFAHRNGVRRVGPLQHAGHTHRIPLLHAQRVSASPSISLLAAPPRPMAIPARPLSDLLGRTVCDRYLGDTRANGDAVFLAPRREDRFAEAKAPLERTNRLAVLPVARLDQLPNLARVMQLHRASSWRPAAIVSIADHRYNGTVWNLAVEQDETYLAQNVIVHNCRAMLVPIPITEDVDVEAFITPEIVGQAKELAGDGFV